LPASHRNELREARGDTSENIEERGRLFIGAQAEIYEGMIIG